MMTHFSITLLLTIFFVLPTRLQTRPVLLPTAFEGTIDLKVTSPRFTGVMMLSLSPLGTRLDLKGKEEMSVSFLSLPNDTLAYSLMHGSRTYSQTNLGAARRSLAALNANTVYKVVKLGKEKVGKYLCEHFTVQSGRNSVGAEIEIWTSTAVADTSAFERLASAGPLGGIDERFIAAMKAEGVDGFPVRLISRAASGQLSVELLKVRKQKLSKLLFAVPTDYASVTR